MRPTRLEGDALTEALRVVPAWRQAQGWDAIERQFTFRDFNTAFAFMTRVALWAERADHHPEWSNVYNRVTVTLSTHDATGVTERDIALARFCDESAAALGMVV